MVELDKLKTPQDYLDEVEKMRLETDAILATSAKLIREVEMLLEESRRLKLSRDALMEVREKLKRRPDEPK